MKTIILLFLQIAIVLPSLCFAAGELIPEFANEDEMKSFISRTRRQVPFSIYNNQEFFNAQVRSIQALRKKFPEYDRWMKEKPDPLTIEIFRVDAVDGQSLLLEESTLRHVQQFVLQHLNHEMATLEVHRLGPATLGLLQERGVAALKTYLDRQAAPIRGLIVGLAQVVPPTQKGEFFKLGDPYLQLDFLRRLQISDEQLRKSAFKAETVGLDQASVTYPAVLQVVEQRLHASEQLFLLVSYLKFLNNASEQKYYDTSIDLRSVERLLNENDFDFTYKIQSRLLTSLINILVQNRLLTEQVARSKFEQFQSGFSRLRFRAAALKTESRTLIAKVIEVHPYLGSHRGCIGGDCSSSSSPMFPYSPWEHIFYIQNPTGGFLGYASATRVKIDGVDSFYLKDLSGRTLSAKTAEAVLHALSNAHTYYGTKNFVIARPGFTDVQNHFHELREMLKKYNREGKKVEIEFPDREVRGYIASNPAVFRSTATYDSVRMHTNGVLFPTIALDEVKYSYESHKGTLPVPLPQSIKDEFLMSLQIVTADPNVDRSTLPIDLYELSNKLHYIQNLTGLALKNYYEHVKEIFTSYGFEFNRSFRDQHEALLVEGHLNAKDAFTNPDPTLVNDSIKFFVQWAKQHRSHFKLLQKAKQWKEQLESSPRFTEMLELYSSRLAPHDVFQLFDFALLGFDQAKAILADRSKHPAIELALVHLLQQGPIALNLPHASAFTNSRYKSIILLHNYVALSTQGNVNELESKLTDLFSTAGMDWRALKNRELQMAIENAFLDLNQTFSPHYIQRGTQIAIEHLQAGKLSPKLIYRTLSRLKNSPELFSRFAGIRLNQIRDSQNPPDLVEIHFMHTLGFKQASEVLASPVVQQTYLKMIQEIAMRGRWSIFPELLQMRLEDFYPNRNEPNPLNLAANMAFQVKKVSQFLEKLDETAKALMIPKKTSSILEQLPSAAREKWLQLDDAFTTKDPRAILITIYSLERTAVNNGSFPLEKVLRHFDYLAQWPEFKQMFRNIQTAYFKGDCNSCGEYLAQFALLGKIKDDFSQTPERVDTYLKERQKFLSLIYGFHQARIQNIPIRVSNAQLIQLAEFVGRYNIHYLKETRHQFREMALDVLIMHSPVDAKLGLKYLDLLERAMVKEPINAVAAKIALAFIKQGGSAYIANQSMTRRFPRPTMNTSTNPEELEIFARFKKAVDPGTPSGTFGLKCGFLFERRRL